MVKGPSVNRAERIDEAEMAVDAAIGRNNDGRVEIATSLLCGIRFEDWQTKLRPRYLKAGWKRADWVFDQRDGDYIVLAAD